MEEKKKEIRISVRNLVEFILRSGDLDNSVSYTHLTLPTTPYV